MQQSSKEAAEDNTSSQPQLSTPATVECDDAAECRIINLELLSKHIEDVTQHVATCSTCQQSTNAITVVGEKHRNGLASIIGCKFNGCGQELTFATSTKNSGLTGKLYWTNNLAAVWGQMTVGGGFNSLQESMSVLGVPVMTKQSFIDTERVIGKWWWTALEESMLATKEAIVSSNIASSTDKHFLDVSDASSPTQDISSSFLSDSFPDISGNSFSDSTADTSSSSLSSSILDSPNDTICTRDALVSSTLSTSTPDEIEEDVNVMLLEQQKSWEDATVDTQIELTDSLDPPVPLDHQMICDIQKLASRLAAKSHQLLGNFTTNLAEGYMHIRSKFDGGKQVNRSQRGSWEGRCAGAGLRVNEGPEWGPACWAKVTNSEASKYFKSVSAAKSKKVIADCKRKAKDDIKLQRKRRKRSDNSLQSRLDYSRHDNRGPNATEVPTDICISNLHELMVSYYNVNDKITEPIAQKITINTIDQGDGELGSQTWHEERRKCITSSNVGQIAGFSVSKSGLVVSLKHPWLAASPDGIVYDPNFDPRQGLVEFKNPYTTRDKTIEEAAGSKSFCLQFQIQCAMYCTNRQWCNLVVMTKNLYIERITIDSAFEEKIIPKLKEFYFTAVLPELASPQAVIREPCQWLTNEWNSTYLQLDPH